MKTVLITGASGGIGIATVKKFMSEGYFVIATYNSSPQPLKELRESYKGDDYYRLFTVEMDFENEKSVDLAFEEIKKSFKHIDVVVNNAGKSLNKLITETSESEWNSLLSVNVKSAFTVNNKVLPTMIERKSGNIINVSSIWGKQGASMEVAYSASKSALIGYTRALAKEVGVSGIRVNCVCPGVIATKMNAKLSREDIENLCEETPLKRIGTPQEVAELIYFLASEKASFITGECITIDGGLTL